MARLGAAGGGFCALVLALSACATELLQPGRPRDVTAKAVAPYEAHEECARMVPGDRLDYRFEAQRAVAFNIHYHEGKVVVMAVSVDSTTQESGTFRPLVPHVYCLMWEAGREGAIIDYGVALVRGSR